MRFEQGGYPVNKDGRGIVFENHPIGWETKLITASGSELFCSSTLSSIRVYTPKERFGLAADMSTDGYMTLSLRTQIGDEKSRVRHPDMFAKQFVGFAIHNFERRGIVMNGIYGKWNKDSDNYKSFYEEYDIAKDKVQAAKNTWTSDVVGFYGFTEIKEENIHIDDTSITALFKMPLF